MGAGCRDAEQYRQAETMKGLLVLRVNGPVCFANVEYIKECLARHEVCCCNATHCSLTLLKQVQLECTCSSPNNTTAAPKHQYVPLFSPTSPPSPPLLDPFAAVSSVLFTDLMPWSVITGVIRLVGWLKHLSFTNCYKCIAG